MADAHESTHDNGHGHESHGSMGSYVTIGVMLLILTGISFVTPHFFAEMPGVMRMIMIAVSCCKAMLVIMFFMHLKWEANWKYVLTFPAMCMSVFLVLMLVPDIAWRLEHASRERKLHMAVPPATATDHDGDHQRQKAPHANHP